MRNFRVIAALILMFVLQTGPGLAGNETAESPSLDLRPFSTTLADGTWIGNAICYGPHRDGQSPDGESPTPEQIRADLELMLPHWNLLRVYGSQGPTETLLQLIHQDDLEMKVMLGAWIANEAKEANQKEIQAAIHLANKYPDVVTAVSVGNETQVYWSAHRSSADQLIKYIQQVRRAVSVPVTTADDYNFWNKPESRQVAAAVDFITLHAHPLWNGKQREESLTWLQEQVEVVSRLHPDRPLLIGETGWATQVHNEGEQARLCIGQADARQQKLFYEDVRRWAASEQFPVFFFEAFDENWKGGPHPNEVEKHWGVFHADRTAKEALQP